MKVGSGRRKYDKQFKEEAKGLVIKGGRTVPDVARGLGIHENLLYKGKKQYYADPQSSFPRRRHLNSG